MYNLNYIPTNLGVKNWKEIISGGTWTKKVEYHCTRRQLIFMFTTPCHQPYQYGSSTNFWGGYNTSAIRSRFLNFFRIKANWIALNIVQNNRSFQSFIHTTILPFSSTKVRNWNSLTKQSNNCYIQCVILRKTENSSKYSGPEQNSKLRSYSSSDLRSNLLKICSHQDRQYLKPSMLIYLFGPN
jgi:hypothetical protein